MDRAAPNEPRASSSRARGHGLGSLVRAVLAGGGATAVDLAVLTALVAIFGVAPRIASLPALAAGGIVSFFANRHWVFRAGRGSLPVQAALYLVVELAALALNGLLYDAAMRTAILHAHPSWYAPARLVTSHVVFLAWSYPLWRLVFRVRRQPA
jgi:putative flippase GtrA